MRNIGRAGFTGIKRPRQLQKADPGWRRDRPYSGGLLGAVCPYCAFGLAINLAADIRSHVIDTVGTIMCSFGVAEFEHIDTAETRMALADEAF